MPLSKYRNRYSISHFLNKSTCQVHASKFKFDFLSERESIVSLDHSQRPILTTQCVLVEGILLFLSYLKYESSKNNFAFLTNLKKIHGVKSVRIAPALKVKKKKHVPIKTIKFNYSQTCENETRL